MIKRDVLGVEAKAWEHGMPKGCSGSSDRMFGSRRLYLFRLNDIRIRFVCFRGDVAPPQFVFHKLFVRPNLRRKAGDGGAPDVCPSRHGRSELTSRRDMGSGREMVEMGGGKILLV